MSIAASLGNHLLPLVRARLRAYLRTKMAPTLLRQRLRCPQSREWRLPNLTPLRQDLERLDQRVEASLLCKTTYTLAFIRSQSV